MIKKIRASLKERSYDILVGHGLLKKSGALLRKLKLGRDAVCITNRKIYNLYGRVLASSLGRSGFTVRFEIVPDSEKAKSVDVAMAIVNRISEYDKYKTIFIISLGGGVIGDLAGFIAALYKRGVPYVQIPTTLLAQVDSAIGGKVAINLEIAKNMAGAFYQPRIVISDISLIKTLPKRQIINGLSEIIKYGIIKDRPLFGFLEANYKKILKGDKYALEHAISRSSRIKADVVAKDEFDKKGIRAILNYGHTIGHAIESAGSYSDRYQHGEAVAIGMAVAAEIALKLKMISRTDANRIKELITKAGLPITVKDIKISDIYESHLRDKKFTRGKNRFILPSGIGRVKVVEGVPDSVIKEVLRKIFKR